MEISLAGNKWEAGKGGGGGRVAGVGGPVGEKISALMGSVIHSPCSVRK